MALSTKSRRKLEAAMREVHENVPSTVRRAQVSGARKEKMKQAIAFRKAGIRRRPSGSASFQDGELRKGFRRV